MNRPRIIIADDHKIVSEGLQRRLANDFETVAIVEDGRALVDAVKIYNPQVVISDISMPGLNGLDAFTLLKKERPDIRMVFLTMHHNIAFARQAIEAGALGYVLKNTSAAELIMAVRAALNGQTFISPALAGEVLQSIRSDPGQAGNPAARLTPRQRQILQLFAQGGSAKEVAVTLGISSRTVEFHKYQMMQNLRIENSAELVHFAIKNGLIGL